MFQDEHDDDNDDNNNVEASASNTRSQSHIGSAMHAYHLTSVLVCAIDIVGVRDARAKMWQRCPALVAAAAAARFSRTLKSTLKRPWEARLSTHLCSGQRRQQSAAAATTTTVYIHAAYIHRMLVCHTMCFITARAYDMSSSSLSLLLHAHTNEYARSFARSRVDQKTPYLFLSSRINDVMMMQRSCSTHTQHQIGIERCCLRARLYVWIETRTLKIT